jgi:hypothetical protein
VKKRGGAKKIQVDTCKGRGQKGNNIYKSLKLSKERKKHA